jgi:hypothetical protein
LRHYLTRLGIAFAAFIAAAACINLLVDPYRLWNPPVGLDAAAPRPRAVQHDASLKLRGIARTRPVTLILGNSRAEIGFDPRATAWPAAMHPVYNAAVPGASLGMAEAALASGIAAGRLRTAVVGLDFLDFLVASNESVEPAAPAAPRTNDLSVLISLDTLIDSGLTVLQRHDPDAADVDASGFNPLHEYRRYAREEGYASIFRQRDATNARTYVKSPKGIFVNGGTESASWRELERLVATARAADIRLEFVIYPYHARILEMFYHAGLAPAFKQWKRELARRLPATATGSCSVWDFSGYSEFTTESVPAAGDRTSTTRWYWESGHFKSELGSVMLERMYDGSGSFGTCLTESSVGMENARLDAGHESFAKRHPDVAAGVLKLFSSASP